MFYTFFYFDVKVIQYTCIYYSYASTYEREREREREREIIYGSLMAFSPV